MGKGNSPERESPAHGARTLGQIAGHGDQEAAGDDRGGSAGRDRGGANQGVSNNLSGAKLSAADFVDLVLREFFDHDFQLSVRLAINALI